VYKNWCWYIGGGYYAALLPRRGPHNASHSVCPSVCPSVPLSVFSAPLASRMYFSARTEGRISYGHLGRTDSCFTRVPVVTNICIASSLFAAKLLVQQWKYNNIMGVLRNQLYPTNIDHYNECRPNSLWYDACVMLH